MIDGNDPKYISDEMIDKAIAFIGLNIDNDVFTYYSEGKSRGPSLALIYLLEKDLISRRNTFEKFKEIYPLYAPKKVMYCI